MISGTPLITLVLKALAVALLCRTTWMAYRSGGQPSAEPFVLLSATLTLWAGFSLGAAVPGVTAVSPLEAFFDLARLGSVLVLPVAWIVYALSYTGRGIMATRKRIVLVSGIVIPAVIGVIAVASDASKPVVGSVLGLALGWTVLYWFSLLLYALYATYLLVGLSLGSSPRFEHTDTHADGRRRGAGSALRRGGGYSAGRRHDGRSAPVGRVADRVATMVSGVDRVPEGRLRRADTRGRNPPRGAGRSRLGRSRPR